MAFRLTGRRPVEYAAGAALLAAAIGGAVYLWRRRSRAAASATALTTAPPSGAADHDFGSPEANFWAAVVHSKRVDMRGYSASDKLGLYRLYKQATIGPCNVEAPSRADIAARYKWEAWTSCGDMPTAEAQRLYIVAWDCLTPGWRGGVDPAAVSKAMAEAGAVGAAAPVGDSDDQASDSASSGGGGGGGGSSWGMSATSRIKGTLMGDAGDDLPPPLASASPSCAAAAAGGGGGSGGASTAASATCSGHSAAAAAGSSAASSTPASALAPAVAASRDRLCELAAASGEGAGAALASFLDTWASTHANALPRSPAAAAAIRVLVNAPMNAVSETALHFAADAGAEECVRVLLAAGANPNAVETGGGQTPLHYAALAENEEVTAALLAAGADGAIVDLDGKPAHPTSE